MTLGDVGRKKYFIGVLFHFGQKMRLGLGSMIFQTFCIFRTAMFLFESVLDIFLSPLTPHYSALKTSLII